MAGTVWNTFAAGTIGFADDYNENFDWIEGDAAPMLNGTRVHNTYNFGSGTFKWKSGYFSNGIIINSTQTLSSFDNSTVEVSSGILRLKNGGIRGSTANTGGSQQEISQGTISTPNLRANSCTIMTTTASGSQTTGTTITAAALTTAGNPILICGFAQFFVTTAAVGGAASVDLSIHRYDIALGTATGVAGGKLNWQENGIGAGFTARPCMRIMIQDAPSGAFNNYKYEMRYTLNAGFSVSVERYYLFMNEIKR